MEDTVVSVVTQTQIKRRKKLKADSDSVWTRDNTNYSEKAFILGLNDLVLKKLMWNLYVAKQEVRDLESEGEYQKAKWIQHDVDMWNEEVELYLSKVVARA